MIVRVGIGGATSGYCWKTGANAVILPECGSHRVVPTEGSAGARWKDEVMCEDSPCGRHTGRGPVACARRREYVCSVILT
jgi:hypothetical protein